MGALGALYVGGNRDPKISFPLRTSQFYRDRSVAGYHITQGAVEQARQHGSITQIGPRGVEAGSKFHRLPAIAIRRKTDWETGSPSRLIVSQTEAAGLAQCFDLPPQLIKQAYFVLAGMEQITNHRINIRVNFSELMDPAWADQYLAWLKNPAKNPLPTPARFPWQTILSSLTMPLLPKPLRADHFGAASLAGELELMMRGNQPSAFFYLAPGRRCAYALGLDGFELLSCASREDETFLLSEFKELLGLQPARKVYVASKRARPTGITFGNVDGIPYVLLAKGDASFEDGKLFHFRFTRNGGSLEVECYCDPGMQPEALAGRRSLQLEEDGFPMMPKFRLNPPAAKQ